MLFKKPAVVVHRYESPKEYLQGIKKMTKKGYSSTSIEKLEERVGCMALILFPPLIFRRNKQITIVTWELEEIEETAGRNE